MKNIFSSFNDITSGQFRSILMPVILLVIPLLAVIGLFDSFMEKRMRSNSVVLAINRSTSTVNDNDDILTVLSKASFRSYKERDITAGINPISLNRYFSTYANLLAKEEARKQLELERARIEAEEEARKRKVEDIPAVVKKETEEVTDYANKITYIYISSVSSNSIVVIDDKMLKVGGITPSGSKVKKIESNRVLLEGTRGLQWVQLKF